MKEYGSEGEKEGRREEEESKGGNGRRKQKESEGGNGRREEGEDMHVTKERQIRKIRRKNILYLHLI